VRQVEVSFWLEEWAVVQILIVTVYSHFERAKNTSTQSLCKWFTSILKGTQRPALKDIVNGLRKPSVNARSHRSSRSARSHRSCETLGDVG
jgi:hypothetical protein